MFTSPSSVNNEPNATHSGNARSHGMWSITKASIAYVVTQVCTIMILAASTLTHEVGLICIDIGAGIFLHGSHH
jgi:hypothetical protein